MKALPYVLAFSVLSIGCAESHEGRGIPDASPTTDAFVVTPTDAAAIPTDAGTECECEHDFLVEGRGIASDSMFSELDGCDEFEVLADESDTAALVDLGFRCEAVEEDGTVNCTVRGPYLDCAIRRAACVSAMFARGNPLCYIWGP